MEKVCLLKDSMKRKREGRIGRVGFILKRFDCCRKWRRGGEKNPSVNFDVDLTLISKLWKNDIKFWGMGSGRTKENRPKDAILSQMRYSYLKADFIHKNSRKVYLTLDEGYENGYSRIILNILKSKRVRAVFFVTMDYVKKEPEIVRRIIDDGHILGSHSVSHPVEGMPNLSLAEQLSEMRELHEYVEREFDYSMYLFRFPSGIYSEQSMALMSAIGYRSVFWSFAYADWRRDKQPHPRGAIKLIMEQLHPGEIFLLHAVSETNACIMEEFIDCVRSKGYEFACYEI